MRQIKLELSNLQVESFATIAPAAGRGTVLGHAKTYVENTECCETYAPYVCASANDGCPTLVHALTYCSPECQPTEPGVCGGGPATDACL
ncbi:hypothetical protein [Longimicrobium terrae]|uniref:Uncharacterized protein n=1 Tax=Longimicrobium terrae TaxID=1639882 RepID=A0A841H4L5_9BACT|nr:hypothetical protein [Longimicrobium terrae]MBB4638428.1 hypothetical protein [Longimicrobium terrae]MBB6072729.1 hypothetical protein [Longimicrobium terrae]NNC32397.1 hypothetical protein [Longimicrobium terrae]